MASLLTLFMENRFRFALIFAILGIFIGGLGIGPVYATSTIFEINGNHDCIYYMQHGQSCWEITTPNGTMQIGPNWQIDVFTPSGACNITGTMDKSLGTCSSPSFVLSPDNMTVFRTNISVLAVKAIQTTDHPNQNYCPLAQWTWDNQDSVFKTKYANYTALIIPTYCNVELGGHTIPTVPEFGTYDVIILSIATLTMVIFASRTRPKLS
jgi:hypothetical protein